MVRTANIKKHHNFWNDLRVRQQLKYSDIAEVVNLNKTSIAKFFSGASMPKVKYVKAICDFFDVDFDKGYSEFVKIFKEYHNPEENDDIEPNINTDLTSEVTDDDGNLRYKITLETTANEAPKSTVLEMLYGKVSCSVFFDFASIVANKSGDPLELIYGKVSFEDYESIRSSIKDGLYPDSNETFYQYPNEIPVFDKWGNVTGMMKREEN